MCRTAHALLQTVICGIQMLVRVFMTVILMIENVIRMLLQTLYNFISFLLQMISLVPICVVFLLTARLKCFMCGGGGPCPVNRGGTCDCLMSAMAILILFFIFRATGVLDKIFYSMGYITAPTAVARFIPTPGDITECSRNDTEMTETMTTQTAELEDFTSTLEPTEELYYDDEDEKTTTLDYESYIEYETSAVTIGVTETEGTTTGPSPERKLFSKIIQQGAGKTKGKKTSDKGQWTTILYYLL